MRTRMLVIAALAAVLTLLAASCGGDEAEDAAPAPPPPAETGGAEPAPPPAETEAASGGGEPVQGGIFRIGSTGEVDSLNPFVAFNAEAYESFIYTYPILVQYNADFEFEGDWAESWETSPDGLVWTFTLKPGEWSDGTPLTAEDAAWTGETILKYKDGPTANLAPFLSYVASFEAPDPQTLVVTYERPIGNVLPQLQQFFVLPKHIWQEFDTNSGKGLKTFNPQDRLPLVSGGPFTVTKFEKKGTTIYERNPGFYGQQPYVDAVGWQHFENQDAMLQAFKGGELDYIAEFPRSAISAFEGDEGFTIETAENTTIYNFIFNSNPDKPKNRELLDPKVREAFAHAIDRQEIAEVVYGGTAKPVVSIVAPIAGEWVNPEIEIEPFDTARANQILDEAGYALGSDGVRVDPDGEKMEYEVITPQGVEGVNRSFEIVQAGLDQVGIKLISKPLDDTTAFEEILAPDSKYEQFDLAMWSWVGYLDPDFVLSVTTCDQWGGWSDTGYCNEEYDALYQEQGAEPDQATRREIVWQMQDIHQQDRPYIHIVNADLVTAVAAGWEDTFSSLGGYSKLPWVGVHKVEG